MGVEGIEGVGEVARGGMLARAVEPEAGESEASAETRGNCLNCGAELVGEYCFRCGQKARVHRTLSAWWHDFLHSVLHLDGKFWRTLPLLAWRPGELTRRYLEGERARFVSPLALFLFSVFLMFAVFSTVGGPLGREAATVPPEARQEVEAERRTMQAELSRLEARRARMAAQGQDTRAADRRLQDLQRELEVVTIVQRTTESGLNISLTEQPSRIGWLNRAYQRARENPSLLIYKLQANAYKFSWALIPISVPFVWLLFLHRQRYRRRYGGYDHVVFVTYSIAFMTLLAVAVSLVQPVLRSSDAAILLFVLAPPFHMYRQLKGAYGLTRFSALWRAALLVLFALFSAMLFLALLLTIGVLG